MKENKELINIDNFDFTKYKLIVIQKDKIGSGSTTSLIRIVNKLIYQKLKNKESINKICLINDDRKSYFPFDLESNQMTLEELSNYNKIKVIDEYENYPDYYDIVIIKEFHNKNRLERINKFLSLVPNTIFLLDGRNDLFYLYSLVGKIILENRLEEKDILLLETNITEDNKFELYKINKDFKYD